MKPNNARTGYCYVAELKFPAEFTMKQLMAKNKNKISYITLAKRVEKAIELGKVVKLGKKEPGVLRKGRKEMIYQRVNVVAVAPADHTAAAVVA